MNNHLIRYYNILYTSFRTFTDPNPCRRIVLNAVSSLSTSFLCSLRKGVVRGCSFNVTVRRDVFQYLFGNCGRAACRRRGKFYNRCDFNCSFFNDSDFVYRNDCNECVSVDFPVLMYSYVKFVKLCDRVDFCETVTLVKKRC